jgi:hypothetical protein
LQLLLEKDIVFTTFATAAAEYKQGQSPLSKVHWFRIVLDEGSEISPILQSLTDRTFTQRIKSETAPPSSLRLYNTSQRSAVGALLGRLSKTVSKTWAASLHSLEYHIWRRLPPSVRA